MGLVCETNSDWSQSLKKLLLKKASQWKFEAGQCDNTIFYPVKKRIGECLGWMA
jgi:hypothetical protein